MKMKLTQDFYQQSALEVAPSLIGKLLCRLVDGEIIKLRITETEAYYGESDTACHAHKGKTARTSVMYEAGGVAYIYLCYGIHHLFNVVTGSANFPEAVLIRGVEGFYGPGKLTKALKIDKTLNTIDLAESNLLWLEDDGVSLPYETTARIGIDYACDTYRNIPWRFVLKK